MDDEFKGMKRERRIAEIRRQRGCVMHREALDRERLDASATGNE